MGTSMKKAVFTERVMQGLKRWRRKARKNILANLRNTTWQDGRPSLDASLIDTNSIGTSPSFGTLDASFSVDAESVAVEIVEEDDDQNIRDREYDSSESDQERRQIKMSSFDGFRLSHRYSSD